ncbi:MAG TPA: hypothetical protein VGC42_19135 [Kofleriaceae bacterium]
MSRRVVFRADASHRLGYGHVARIAAVVEAVAAAGGEPVLMIDGDAGVTGWLASQGLAAEVRAWTLDDLLAAAPDTVVIDGAPLAEALVPALAARAIRTAVIDDRGGCALPADTIINHNHHAAALAASYPRARRLLLGRGYLMLRAALRRLGRGACRPPPGDRLRLAVSFGGSDPVGATVRTLRALPDDRTLHVLAIAGPGYRDLAALRAVASPHVVEVIVAPGEPGAIFATAHAAVGSAGGTLGELAYLGCPAYALAIVDDQRAPARALARDGLIAGGDDWATLTDIALRADLRAFLRDAAGRDALAARALATADGEGPARIADELLR